MTFTVIADFTRGTDVISLYSIFTSTLTPALSNASYSVAATDQITWTVDGSDTKVVIAGNASEYLMLNLTGVTTLALTDFEIL